MVEQNQPQDLIGSEVYGSDGDKIGKIGQVYLDDASGKPEWLTVSTGLFGTNESFVPLGEASFSAGRVTVPYDKSTVKDAPNVAEDGHLDPDEERRLYEYYGRTYSGVEADSGAGYGQTTTGRSEGYDTSGPNTDDAMTVSEEQVNVGTRQQETGRARLRKYVVTENVTQTVPVQRERAVVDREPITDENVGAATSGPSISEEEHELVLHEEVPVVEKEVRPVERVRLGTEAVSDQESVSEEVRKERVDVEGDVDRR